MILKTLKRCFFLLALALILFSSKPVLAGDVVFDWAKGMGGVSIQYADSITVDSSGNVYTTGNFFGATDFNPGGSGGSLTSSGAEGDSFITKHLADGTFVWAKRMINSDVTSIAVDSSGNVYTTGIFWGNANFNPGGSGGSLTSSNESYDIFITKHLANGTFSWAKRMGGSDGDFVSKITLDSSGNIYTTGFFSGTTDFNPGGSGGSLISAGGDDVFITKHLANGTFSWVKRMGGVSSESVASISVDSFGNVYTAGYFWGTVDFDPGDDVFDLVSNGNRDIFISKLDANGNFVWAKRMGGSISDQGNSIAVDSSGNVYTTGAFQGTADFNPGGSSGILTSAGNNDVFITKHLVDGTFVWAKKMGGTSSDQGHSIAVDSLGNVYSIGNFWNSADFDPGADVFSLYSPAEESMFISKLDSGGNFVWAKSLRAKISTFGDHSIALDSFSNIYIAGWFFGTVDFDPGVGVSNLVSAGDQDAFILKLKLEKIITNAASDIQTGSATINGRVKDLDAFNPNSRGFNWGLSTTTFATTTDSGPFIEDIYSYNLSNLTCGTTYYYRAYATNNEETAYGAWLSFNSKTCLSVETSQPSGVNEYTAIINGNILAINLLNPTVRGFNWGISTTTFATTTENGTFSTGAYSYNLSNLIPGTTYYYRAYATDNLGTSYSEWNLFTTNRVLELSSTVGNLNSNSATLNGNILFTRESSPTVRGFNWGISTTTFATTTENGTFSTGAYSYNLSNLTPGTTYYYRAYATDNLGTSYSEWNLFTTNRALELSSTVGNLNSNAATLNGNILSTRESSPTVRGFNWGISTSTFATTTENGTFSTGAYSYNLSNLTPGTTYYYRAYATDNLGTSYSEWNLFTTNRVLELSSTVGNLNSNSATLNGNILFTRESSPTVRGFNWGISTTTFATTTENGTFSTGDYSYNLLNLARGTTYYYRAYATDNLGTSYSEWNSFFYTYPTEIMSLNLPATSTSLTVPVEITATPNVTAYILTESSTPPTADDTGWQSEAPTSYTFSSQNQTNNGQWSKVKIWNYHRGGDIISSVDGQSVVSVISGNSDEGHPGAILSSNNYAQTWTSKNLNGYWQSISGSLDLEEVAISTNDSYGSSGLYFSSNNLTSFNWMSLPGSGVYGKSSFSYSGSRLLVTRGGYIYVSNDNGVTWSQKIQARIVSHSSYDNIAAAKYGGYIYTSNDGGENWTERTGSGYRNWYGIYYSANGLNITATVFGGYIYTSSDGGVTWVERSGAGTSYWKKIITSPDGQKILAVPDSGYVKMSLDGGETWQDLVGAGSEYWVSVAASSDFSKIYLMSRSSNYQTYVHSLTFGNTLHAWAKDADGNISGISPFSINTVEIFDAEKPVINSINAATSSSALLFSLSNYNVSDNIGVTGYLVTESTSTPALNDVSWVASSPIYYTFASSGQKTLRVYAKDLTGNISDPFVINVNVNLKPTINNLVTSSDPNSLTVTINSLTASDPEGESLSYAITEVNEKPSASDSRWQSQVPSSYTFSEPKSIKPTTWNLVRTVSGSTQQIANSVNSRNIFILSNNNTLSASYDYGQNWQTITIPSGTWLDMSVSDDGLKIALTGNSKVITSIDGGASWINGQAGNFKAIKSSTDGSKIVTGGYSTDIYMSNDSGATWSPSGVGSGSWFSFSMTGNGSKIVASNLGDNDNIWISTNGGVSYLKKTRPSGWLEYYALNYSRYGNKLIIRVYADDVDKYYLSEDDGDNWSEFKVGESPVTSYIISGSNDEHIIAKAGGVDYQSLDGGEIWSQLNLNLSATFYTSSHDGAILIGRSGSSIHDSNLNIYTSTLGNSLYAWVKDASGNVSDSSFKSSALINLQPIYLSASSSESIALSPEMKHTETTINSIDSTSKISLNLSSVVETTDGSKTATFAEKLVANVSSDVRLEVFGGTTMTASNLNWSEIFSLPQQRTSGSIALNTRDVISIFEIGDPDSTLTLNKAVRITFFGQAGNNVGFINNIGQFKAIDTTCTGDSQTDGDALPTYGDCKINVGSDLIVWTKHFSEYVIYTGDNPVYTPVSSSSSSTINAATPLVISSCSEVVYDAWQTTCISGKQFRNVLSKSPNFCSLTAEQRALTERSCGELATTTTPEVNEPAKDNQSVVTTPGNHITSVYQYERSLLSKIIDKKLSTKLAGRILLQVETKGQAWYLDPKSLSRYYLADGPTAYQALRQFGLGITNKDLDQIPVAPTSALPDSYKKSSKTSKTLTNKLKGKILLQVENRGEAWYVNPQDGYRYYLANGEAAYQIMRQLSLGISNDNIRKIGIGENK